MKIVIINLVKNKEKRKEIIKILSDFELWANIKLNYSFFNAIDGNEINYNDVNINYFWYEPYSHLHLTKGEVGCALSHTSVWESFINDYEKRENNNENCIMILEDDFIIQNKEIFKQIVGIKKLDSEFLYLGRKKMVDKEEKVSTLLKNQINCKVVESSFSYWAVAYIINYEGAKKLLKSENNFYVNNLFPVDEYIPWLYGQKSIYSLKDMPDDNSKFLAIEPSIIRPNGTAFQNSQTYFSYACPKFRNDIVLVTVATEYNDAVKRYVETANKYGFDPIILGLKETWSGGNMIEGVGGGQKVNMLRNYLKTLKKRKLIVFTDSYDVIVNDNINTFIDKYNEYYKDKIVFGSECSCWPDQELKEYYPKSNYKNKYLNSGNFVGWSDQLLNIMDIDIEDSDDDQLYYTMKYLYSIINDKSICLDYDCKLFLCLNSQYSYNIDCDKSCIITNNNERPNFIHGNGPLSVKRRLNRISNYCTMGWNGIYGYKSIDKWNDNLPNILILYDISNGKNPETIKSICNLNYDKEKMNILEVEFDKINYNKINEDFDFDFIFYINSNIILNNKDILLNLINENKNIISPMFVKKGSLFSNFWGDIDQNNFYKRSDDYLDLINYKKKGVWNVAYVSQCFLMKKKYFIKELFTDNLEKGDGWDMAMCYNLRLNNIFMWVMNVEIYGEFIDFKSKHNDEIELDKYVRTILKKEFLESPKFEDIGENILKINIFTEEFCNLIIEKCNNYGNWSKGGEQYYDKRIGNIENYPTQDIHLHEINLDRVWGYIVHKYISPLVWDYYKYLTKDINIAFVVKYDMEGQRDLKPHHDASTYTINICLNDNFQGGGCRFIKQNKDVINKDVGSMIIHPGKLTHYHEGIPITNGERYILVSFIN